MKKIAGQVIALTKAVFLIEPTTEPGYLSQFFVGKQNKASFGSGFGLSWWYTRATFKTVEAIAAMLIETTPEFANCDRDSVKETINDTLREVCIDKSIFDTDMVCFRRRGTLFECKQPIRADVFAQTILAAIVKNVNMAIVSRCTVYVAPRLSGSTFFLESRGIGVIARLDECAWQALIAKGYLMNGWNPSTGDLAGNENTVFSKLKYDYVFFCEEHGTKKGCKFSSELKLRNLFSVVFSIATEQDNWRLTKSSAAPYSTCIQFHKASPEENSVTISDIGPLIPYYISDKALSDVSIAIICAWFTSACKLRPDNLSRVEKCAHFISRAMNSDDIESYVNYYIALDALFGERGSVEASILSGIKELKREKSDEEKASWLFDLRNELVHGGSRYVSEWPKYQRYYRHFDSRPEKDIERIAFAALSRVPAVFA